MTTTIDAPSTADNAAAGTDAGSNSAAADSTAAGSAVADTAASHSPAGETASWYVICASGRLQPERGVAALVAGRQIALFRTFSGDVYAVGNIDPFSGAAVLSRGIVGSRGPQDTVASPLHKQVFALATGECLDDASVTIPSYRCRVVDDQIEVEVHSP